MPRLDFEKRMSLHFAPPPSGPNSTGRTCACSPIAKAMATRALERVANDNEAHGARRAIDGNDKMLRAALRHFAEHGLGAAREARAQAEAAFFEGDRQAYQWWLGITRTLDRRLAREAVGVETLPNLETR